MSLRSIFTLLLYATSLLSRVRGQISSRDYVNAPSAYHQDQAIVWKPCTPDGSKRFQCGSIKVPVDWTGVNTDILTIPLARWAADSSYPNPRSIIINPGGPGESGLVALIGGILDASWDDWVPSYNVIGFDPRGVGLTVAYKCPDVPEHDDLENLKSQYFYATEQGARCAQADVRELGELMGTAFVARDINAIAEALGEDGLIRYWGFSYGTVLGSTLAAMFPDKIDRMVLDGNVNPTEFYHGTYEESVAGVDPALEYFFRQCYEEGEIPCPFAKYGHSADELVEKFVDILHATVDGRLDSEVGDYQSLREDVKKALKDPDEYYGVAVALAEAQAALMQSSRSPSKRSAPPTAPTAGTLNYSNAITAINCGDWDDIPGTLSDWEQWYESYHTVSKFFPDYSIGILRSCSAWQLNSREKYRGSWSKIETRHPILFVNSPYDPLTPLESAVNASAGFVDSKVLVHEGPGHCSDASPSTCTRKAVAAYFLTGEMPDVSEPCKPDNALFNTSMVLATSPRLRPRDMAFDDFPEVLQSFAHENDHLFQKPWSYAAQRMCSHVPQEAHTYASNEDPLVSDSSSLDNLSESKSLASDGHLSSADLQDEISTFREVCSKVNDGSWLLKILCNAVR